MPETPGRVAPETTVAQSVIEPGKPIRRHRGLRITLLSFASVIVLLGAFVAGGFAYANHEAGRIHRIPVKFTTLRVAGAAGGMTVLLTSNQVGYTGTSEQADDTGHTGMIMLLHINASQKTGGVVSISPEIWAQVPGHGQMQLTNVLKAGGPSLLVKTVQSLTGVPINHYARIDFNHTAAVVNALGGVTVTVTLPATAVAFGHVLKAGVNQLNGVTAVAYTRQFSLSEQQRVLRQQNLMRAMLTRLAQEHLLTNPVTSVRVLSAITGALSVDSNFSNSQIEKLAIKLRTLGAGSSTFVTAPVKTAGSTVTLNSAVASQLWNAINHDSITAFAQRYPSTITPSSPG
jgi:LCP family protein required for cell wall assembly